MATCVFQRNVFQNDVFQVCPPPFADPGADGAELDRIRRLMARQALIDARARADRVRRGAIALALRELGHDELDDDGLN